MLQKAAEGFKETHAAYRTHVQAAGEVFTQMISRAQPLLEEVGGPNDASGEGDAADVHF